ncbi:MAG TPA: nuclear transport factor 2 family protein [Gemmatimonadales bacterium]|nr:nuclear transport factor 2 family protein [Gemmatimonadales bacterium]
MPVPRVACLLLSSLVLGVSARAHAQEPMVEEVRAAIRQYDAALRRADVAALERFWAQEYSLVNPRGERLTREERLANVRSGRTAFDSLAPVPQEERIRLYGEKGDRKNVVAVHTTLLTIGGRYSGHGERGQYRAMAIWVYRDGRWQQVASQLTPVLGP